MTVFRCPTQDNRLDHTRANIFSFAPQRPHLDAGQRAIVLELSIGEAVRIRMWPTRRSAASSGSAELVGGAHSARSPVRNPGEMQ
jgi:hypothetical protein